MCARTFIVHSAVIEGSDTSATFSFVSPTLKAVSTLFTSSYAAMSCFSTVHVTCRSVASSGWKVATKLSNLSPTNIVTLVGSDNPVVGTRRTHFTCSWTSSTSVLPLPSAFTVICTGPPIATPSSSPVFLLTFIMFSSDEVHSTSRSEASSGSIL